MESRAYLEWNDPIRWGAHLIGPCRISDKHNATSRGNVENRTKWQRMSKSNDYWSSRDQL
jgi:hypothetical protein